MVSHSVELAADRSSVWDWVTDPANFDEFVSGYEGGETLSEHPTGLGASYHWYARLGPVRLKAKETIVGWDPPQEVQYDGTLIGTNFRSSVHLDDLGQDRSRVTVTIDSTPPISAVLGLLGDSVVSSYVHRSLDRLEHRFPGTGEDGGGGSDHEDRLRSVRRVYDVWGRHPGLYAAQDWITFLGRPRFVRASAVEAMTAGKGGRVLEVACGTGRNFSYIEKVIGPDGELVGLDCSAGMLEAARSHAARADWHNIRLVHGDAAVLDVGDRPFDGVLCVLGMSAIPEMTAAIERCHEVLRPGGVLSVCDARLFSGRLELLNPLTRAVYGRFAGWNPNRDISASVRDVFGNVEVATYNGGTFFIAQAKRAV